MTDPLDGLDAARRAGWVRSYDTEEVAAHMLFSLYLSGVLANDRQDFERRARKMIEEWLNAGDTRPGWVDGDQEPPLPTAGRVDARIRIARRFLEIEKPWSDS